MPKLPDIFELLGRTRQSATRALPAPSASVEVAAQAGVPGPAQGRPYRVTRKNVNDLVMRIIRNELTDDDVAALRVIIEKDTANPGQLTFAEDDAFRQLTSSILSRRTVEGDVVGFAGEGRIQTVFDDLFDARDAKYGRGPTPRRSRNITPRDLLE